MSESDLPKIHLSHDDSIEYLGVDKRNRRCLLRGGIHTIGELVKLIEAEKLRSIRGVGMKSAREIEASIRKTNLMERRNVETDGLAASRGTTTIGGVIAQSKHAATISHAVIAWQLSHIDQLIQSGLLSEDANILGKSISYWMDGVNSLDPWDGFDLLRIIIGSSASICDELAYIFDQLPNNNIKVLLLRYGYAAKTLEDIGDELGVTRERVRQIANTLGLKIWRGLKPIFTSRSVGIFEDRPAFLKIQTALLNAKRMGMKLCFSEWERSMIRSGLVGNFSKREYSDIDPIEALIAVCSVPIKHDPNLLRLPENLSCAIKLSNLGSPHLPARTIESLESFPAKGKKLMTRHSRFSGGVNIKWLSKELRLSLSHVRDVARLLGYREVIGNWFIPGCCEMPNELKISDAFHRSIRKMFRYCGPLKTEDICSGLEHVVSRTSFPVPPAHVMEIFLHEYGYAQEEGLFYWHGKIDEELSRSESIILDFVNSHGPVVHHSGLAQAIIDNELSIPSLHKTLTHSPLFDRLDTGLYKLRGVSVTYESIQHAKEAKKRSPVIRK